MELRNKIIRFHVFLISKLDSSLLTKRFLNKNLILKPFQVNPPTATGFVLIQVTIRIKSIHPYLVTKQLFLSPRLPHKLTTEPSKMFALRNSVKLGEFYKK